jgi:hypothetical protein
LAVLGLALWLRDANGLWRKCGAIKIMIPANCMMDGCVVSMEVVVLDQTLRLFVLGSEIKLKDFGIRDVIIANESNIHGLIDGFNMNLQ